MPIYSYRCDNCEHQFDERQSFSDDNLVDCPNCEKDALQRVYKPARIVFKGSGYYVTDNKASKKSSSTPAKAKEGSSKNGSGETKSTEKKETKSEKKDTKVKDKSK